MAVIVNCIYFLLWCVWARFLGDKGVVDHPCVELFFVLTYFHLYVLDLNEIKLLKCKIWKRQPPCGMLYGNITLFGMAVDHLHPGDPPLPLNSVILLHRTPTLVIISDGPYHIIKHACTHTHTSKLVLLLISIPKNITCSVWSISVSLHWTGLTVISRNNSLCDI